MKVLFKVSELVNLDPVEYEVLPDETSIMDRNYKLKKAEVFARFNIVTRLLIITKEEEEVLVKSLILEFKGETIRIKGKVLLPANCVKDVTYEY